MRKIHTPNHSIPSMCITCRHAINIKGHRINDATTLCTATHPATPINFQVSECSNYDDKRQPEIHEMYKIAWKVNSDKPGSAGFMRPRDYAKARKEGKVESTPFDAEHDY